MILYHASPVIVEKPDLLHSRKDVDFGAGFYLTELYEQAQTWCRRIDYQKWDGIYQSLFFGRIRFRAVQGAFL